MKCKKHKCRAIANHIIEKHLQRNEDSFYTQIKYSNSSNLARTNSQLIPSSLNITKIFSRSIIQLIYRITSASDRTKWHQMDKYLLVWCVAKVLKQRGKQELIPEQQDWLYLSQILNVNQQLLENKWLQLLHSNLRIKKWTREEDQLLILICSESLQTNNWTEIAIRFNSMSRTQRYPKQIRERYNNVLNPTLRKTHWTEGENQKLIELVKLHGKKWSKLCDYFKGRSENQLKAKYNVLSKSIDTKIIIDINKNQEQRTSNKDFQFVNDQQIVQSQNFQQQQGGIEQKQEQTQIYQHLQIPQTQFFQQQKQIQPVFHNYYNHCMYPQYTQTQWNHQNAYHQLNPYYQPNSMQFNTNNYQFTGYYHY